MQNERKGWKWKMYKMLIVDDNNMQIKSLLTFIDWEAFEITEIKTASNGKKGVEVFKKFMPDIVITDVVMPIMDGIAMTKEIQAIKKDIKGDTWLVFPWD